MKIQRILSGILLLLFSSAYAQTGRFHASLSTGPAIPLGKFRHVYAVSPEIHAESGGTLALIFGYDITSQFGASLYIGGTDLEVKDPDDFGQAIYTEWYAAWILPGIYYYQDFGKRVRLNTTLQAGIMGATTPELIQFTVGPDGPMIIHSYQQVGRVFGMGLAATGTYYIWKPFGVFAGCRYLYARPTFPYGKQPMHILQIDLGFGFRMFRHHFRR